MSEHKLGDVFWDLPPMINYVPGYDIGCTIFVANHTNIAQEYMLLLSLHREGRPVEESTLRIHQYSWFTLEPGVFTRFYGSLAFEDTNLDLSVKLVEKNTEEPVDSVSTRLVMPTAGAIPPTWPFPTAPTAPAAPGMDLNTLLMLSVATMLMGTQGGLR